jgi:hypothetical protein
MYGHPLIRTLSSDARERPASNREGAALKSCRVRQSRLGSSEEEQPPRKRQVVGSSPTLGSLADARRKHRVRRHNGSVAQMHESARLLPGMSRVGVPPGPPYIHGVVVEMVKPLGAQPSECGFESHRPCSVTGW